MEIVPILSLLVLAFPILMTLLMRRATLKGHEEGKSGAWFGYRRFLQWNSLGSLVLWLTAFELLSLDQVVGDAVDIAFNGQALVLRMLFIAALTFLPPLLVNVLCAGLSHRVFVEVQGADWSRREIIQQAVWSQMAMIVPLVLFFVGLVQILPYRLDLGALTVLFALFVWLFSARHLQKVTGLEPHALTSGELRDRTFALAERAGGRLRQLYLLPARRAFMANACARSGNSILVTDYLLAHLSKPEVDSVLAHELAHLKRRHPGLLLVAMIVSFVGVGVLAAVVDSEYHLFPRGSLFPFFVLSGMVLFYMVSRRFERTADAVAVQLTGDAESLIRALGKLASINRFPMHWGRLQGLTLSHPSTLRRVEAIARRAGIPGDRLGQLLNETTGKDEENPDRYCIPPSAAPQGKVFSTVYKASISQRLGWSLIAACTLLPASAAFLALRADRQAVTWAILAVGLMTTVLLALWITNVGALWGRSALKRKILERLESQGWAPREWGASFVGLSPGSSPRLYESNFSWDLGFIILSGDTLCYLGEETRFSLRRGQIIDIDLGPGFPSWWPTQRIYISWKDERSGATASVNLGPYDSASARKLYAATSALARRLQAWLREASSTSLITPKCELPGSPALGAVTSQSPRQFGMPRKYVGDAVLMGPVSILVASVFGLWDTPGAWAVMYTMCVAVFVAMGLRVPFSLYSDSTSTGRRAAGLP